VRFGGQGDRSSYLGLLVHAHGELHDTSIGTIRQCLDDRGRIVDGSITSGVLGGYDTDFSTLGGTGVVPGFKLMKRSSGSDGAYRQGGQDFGQGGSEHGEDQSHWVNNQIQAY
jgi:hypothetical protein